MSAWIMFCRIAYQEGRAIVTTSLGSLLVVDDEEMNRDMLGRRLEIEGYSVTTAASGAEALEIISRQPIDAVLLDAMMPIQNGYEVLAEIRKTRSRLELPVLMVTAKNQSDDIVSAFEGGANDYISKPINFPIALARINCHVASKKLSNQLRESETRYSLSARGANDGLWDWDLTSNKVFYSARWKTMLGYAEDEVGDSADEWFSRVHPEDLPHLQQAVAAHRAGKTDQFESEHRMLHKDQTYRWTLTRGVAICDHEGRQTRMAGSQTDITRGKAADPLTGLPNRVLFMDHLERAIKASQNDPSFIVAVLFVDLDRFKFINDSLGHHAGDELLVEVADRLESCMRSTDIVSHLNNRSTVARFGGDEFVVLLNGIKKPENASLVAQRILTVLAEPLKLRGHDVSLSCSIGVAVRPHNDWTASDLLRYADIAMYQAKTNGKSRFCVFDENMRSLAVERLTIEADMKMGLHRGEFQVFYQPIVGLPDERIEGFEALLRWRHPTRGLLGPGAFISIAEETGFIVELGSWVLERACRQIREWQQKSVRETPLFMSVNVASKQLADPMFVDRVADCLAKTGINASSLKLEITESAIVRDPEQAAQTLGRIRDLGIQISLDDFGTGYSSLSYLRQFPINTIKIDRSFIEQIEGSKQAGEIVKTIVALAHNLGMQITAEGIERRTQLSCLNELFCESGQGFLYSVPVEEASIEALLKAEDEQRAEDRFALLRSRRERELMVAGP